MCDTFNFSWNQNMLEASCQQAWTGSSRNYQNTDPDVVGVVLVENWLQRLVLKGPDCGETAFRTAVHHAVNTENTVKQFGHNIETNQRQRLGSDSPETVSTTESIKEQQAVQWTSDLCMNVDVGSVWLGPRVWTGSEHNIN